MEARFIALFISTSHMYRLTKVDKKQKGNGNRAPSHPSDQWGARGHITTVRADISNCVDKLPRNLDSLSAGHLEVVFAGTMMPLAKALVKEKLTVRPDKVVAAVKDDFNMCGERLSARNIKLDAAMTNTVFHEQALAGTREIMDNLQEVENDEKAERGYAKTGIEEGLEQVMEEVSAEAK